MKRGKAEGGHLPPYMMTLRSYRRAQDRTQEELAQVIGVSPDTMRRWEQGEAEPKVSQFILLCEALGVSYETALSGSLF